MKGTVLTGLAASPVGADLLFAQGTFTILNAVSLLDSIKSIGAELLGRRDISSYKLGDRGVEYFGRFTAAKNAWDITKANYDLQNLAIELICDPSGKTAIEVDAL